MHRLTGLLLLVPLACAAADPPSAPPAVPAVPLPADIVPPALGGSVRAELKDARGTVLGAATFMEGTDGVKIAVQAGKLSPGAHGLHLHEAGKCDPPDFKSAGAHFNPHTRKHGLENPAGAHGGDLPNLVVGADGTAKADVVARGVTLLKDKPNSLLDGNGAALVVHARPDDNKTDPSGDSGDRILCGVIAAGTP